MPSLSRYLPREDRDFIRCSGHDEGVVVDVDSVLKSVVRPVLSSRRHNAPPRSRDPLVVRCRTKDEKKELYARH